MLLDFLSRKIISRNSILQNSYQGETCYIFGNGYSLKYLNFDSFKNLNVFTTGLNYIHKDFKKLKIIGDFHLHPGIFSPIWRHPYTKKITIINKMRKFLLKTNRIPENVNFFTSIYNYPFIKKKNKKIFFLNNNKENFNLDKINPSKEFSLMIGSLYAMIGVAAYMGFKKFFFVGMDYLSDQPKHGHFYEYGVRDKIINNLDYIDRIKKLTDFFSDKNNCDFYFLSLSNLKSNIYPNIDYEKTFNIASKYRENLEIVDPRILEDLTKVEFEYFIYEKK